MEITEKELAMLITTAKIEENIFWYNKAHFMAAPKHQERINDLMKGELHGNNRRNEAADHQRVQLESHE